MSLFFSPPFSSVEMRCTRIKRVHYYCYYYYHLIKHVLCEIWHGEFFIACNFKLMRLIITNWKISHAVKANTYKTYKTKCAGNFTLFFYLLEILFLSLFLFHFAILQFEFTRSTLLAIGHCSTGITFILYMYIEAILPKL